MNGYFIASAPGTCSDCNRRTPTGARVRYPADDPTDAVRLCADCSPADLLEVLDVTALVGRGAGR